MFTFAIACGLVFIGNTLSLLHDHSAPSTSTHQSRILSPSPLFLVAMQEEAERIVCMLCMHVCMYVCVGVYMRPYAGMYLCLCMYECILRIVRVTFAHMFMHVSST